MDWISIKDQKPSVENDDQCFVLAYHTIYGVGIARFYALNQDVIEEDEESLKDKYVISCDFVKNRYDEDFLVDTEDEIDIFYKDPHFINLGTVTHWMPFPKLTENLHKDNLEITERMERFEQNIKERKLKREMERFKQYIKERKL